MLKDDIVYTLHVQVLLDHHLVVMTLKGDMVKSTGIVDAVHSVLCGERKGE